MLTSYSDWPLISCLPLQALTYVYDICPNKNCACVFRGTYRDERHCPLCKSPRYKSNGTKPAKIMYYMSMAGYVQYLCSNEEFVRCVRPHG